MTLTKVKEEKNMKTTHDETVQERNFEGRIAEQAQPVFQAKDFNLWYGDNHALQNIDLDFNRNEISAIIGPSGCGKSTFIKALNRMVELVPIVRTEGDILYRDQSIFDKSLTVEELHEGRHGLPEAEPVPQVDL